MKKIVLILSLFYFISCDTVVYKEAIPKSKKDYPFFPLNYDGTYVSSKTRKDTLFIGAKDFYFKLAPTLDGKENTFSRKGRVGKQLKVKLYGKGAFVNSKQYNSSNYWNTRFITLKGNKLYVFKLPNNTDVKSLIYDYNYDNKTKKYIINPSMSELDALINNNIFKLSRVFEKINSTSYKPKLTNSNSQNIKYKAGCIYGDCKGGYGIYKYSNGDSYKGYFKNSKRHGFGDYLWGNIHYSGNWENGNRSGYGNFYKQEINTLYVGEWKNNLISGYGFRINSNLSVDRGLWQSGKIVSRYSYSDSGKRIGCVRGNCNNGYGKYVLTSNSYYEGFFINGKRLLGEYSYKNGDKYKGEFNSSGKREGTGFYTYSNGNVYKGQWLNDKKHGLGIFKYKNGKTYYENYNNGVRVSSKEQKIN
ncbi:hypothetical protein Q4599_16775 [Cellulophaga lytica]|uniref:hypothetical protein n=1 Tax=Cellulophaga lytica TaxID=979 RepID=UPI0026E48CEF|nr:hypothetical protein [Cellulophaga lytica]MDO6855249.1 hypothetical protein [Cellulophaga lytica]